MELHYAFLPPANELLGKVMISQVFVCPIGGGRWGDFPACITGHMTRRFCLQGVCIQRGVCIWAGLDPGGSASRDPREGSVSRGIGQTPSPSPEIHGILGDTCADTLDIWNKYLPLMATKYFLQY